MRARLWSIACGELCYGSQRSNCWRSLRFSNEGSFGMCLRACSQSLGVPLWSLSRLLYLSFLNMALKCTWGFRKANTEQEYIHQVLVQGYLRTAILSSGSLRGVWGLSLRRFWEWLMPGVWSTLIGLTCLFPDSPHLSHDCHHRDRDINIAAWWCTAGRHCTNDEQSGNHYCINIIKSMPVASSLKGIVQRLR